MSENPDSPKFYSKCRGWLSATVFLIYMYFWTTDLCTIFTFLSVYILKWIFATSIPMWTSGVSVVTQDFTNKAVRVTQSLYKALRALQKKTNGISSYFLPTYTYRLIWLCLVVICPRLRATSVLKTTKLAVWEWNREILSLCFPIRISLFFFLIKLFYNEMLEYPDKIV